MRWRTRNRVQKALGAAAPAPKKDLVLWALHVSRPEPYESLQLGAKILDGKQIGLYAYSMTESKQENFHGAITVDGHTMTARFPARRITSLGPSANWYAVLNIAGSDVDACPNAPDPLDMHSLDLKKLSFPSEWF